MKAYLIATGTVFGLIVVAHIWRLSVEGAWLLRDPAYLVLTLLAAALCFWALQLLRRLSKS